MAWVFSTPRQMGKSYFEQVYRNQFSTSGTDNYRFEPLYSDGFIFHEIPGSEDLRKITFLKKELKSKHLNPGLRVQYAKELQALESKA